MNGRIILEDRSRKMPVRLARREGIPSDERSGLNVHTKMERQGLLDDNLARYHRLFYTSCTIFFNKARGNEVEMGCMLESDMKLQRSKHESVQLRWFRKVSRP